MAKKLVCDRCGLELTDKDDIGMAFDGKEAWQAAVRARGLEPRGVYPCKNFMHCRGEMKWVAGNGVFWWRRWIMKSRSQ